MFVESALCHGGLVSFYRVIFAKSLIFKLVVPELWRCATAFLLTGGGFQFVFDMYFSKLQDILLEVSSTHTETVWTYGTGLELNSPRFTHPGDFFTYVFFVCSVILVSAEHAPLRPDSSAFDAFHILNVHLTLAYTSHSARPVSSLSEAVPKEEGEKSCVTCRSDHSQNTTGPVLRHGHEESTI